MIDAREYLIKNLPGNWFSKDLNLEVSIEELEQGYKYLYSYPKPIIRDGTQIEEEVTEIVLLGDKDKLVVTYNSWGKWYLRFNNKDSFELFDEHPDPIKVQYYGFERKE